MRAKILGLFAVLTLLLAVSAIPAAAQQGGPPPGGGPGGPGGRPGGGPPPMMAQLQLTSPAFADGTAVPDKFTCAAGMANMTSPALQWANPPRGVASFLVLLHDPDAHAAKSVYDITHWIIFNIPADATGLPEGVKADAPATVGTQGKNIAGQPGYFGPCAPPGPVHHYTFELLSLDTKLELAAGATRDEIMKAADGHILTSTVLIGLFHRQPGGGMPGAPPPPR